VTSTSKQFALPAPNRGAERMPRLAGRRGVRHAAQQFDVSRSTMSAHFAVLKDADLVHSELQGELASVLTHLRETGLT